MDKKKCLLVVAFWMVSILGSMLVDRWWATCLAGIISILMGTALLLYRRTLNSKGMAIAMIAFGIGQELFTKLEFAFRFLEH